MNLDRRSFLKSGAVLGASAVLGPRFVLGAPAGDPPADTVVVVFLRGGLDPLQAIPPYGDSDYYRLRPNIAIPLPGASGGALPLDERFGLHPSLAPLLPVYQRRRLAVVHATGLKHDERSHFACQDHIETGIHEISGGGHDGHTGWLNRHMAGIGDPGGFHAVGMGSAMQMALRGDASALAMQGISSFSFSSNSSRKAALEDQVYGLFGRDTAVGVASRAALDSTDYLAALNPGALPVHNGATYPTGSFGTQLREVAQLIRSGIGLRIACVDMNGYDHHDAINTELPPLLGELAGGLAAFDTDLGALMNGVTVVVMTEFGRRAFENASGGTDHGCGSMMLLMGGGVLGGQVYNYWPGLKDSQLFNGDLDVTVDYRTVLSELMHKRMGGSGRVVFPDVVGQPQLGCFAKERVGGGTRNPPLPQVPLT